MASKISTIVFCFILVGSNCWAAGSSYDFENSSLSPDAKNFCLKMAVKYSQPDQVEAMLAVGADATVIDLEGRSIFYWLDEAYEAAEKDDGPWLMDDTKEIRDLLDQHFIMLLCTAIEQGSDEKFMKAWNALATNLNEELEYVLGWNDKELNASLLHRAAEYNCPNIVRTLLVFGAPVDAEDCAGRLPVHYARYLGHHEVVEVFEAYGAPVQGKPVAVHNAFKVGKRKLGNHKRRRVA